MTPKAQAQIGAYVRLIADLLELKDWRFLIVADRTNDPDHIAEIETTSGTKLAKIALGDRWDEQDPGAQRQILIHELLHCHWRGVEVVMERLQTNLGDPTYQVVSWLHRDQLELGIDAIADALAPHLPLPNEGEAEEAA